MKFIKEERGRRKKRSRRRRRKVKELQIHVGDHKVSHDFENTKNKRKKYALLSSAEKRSDVYRRVVPGNTWKAPPSSHHLLQEDHSFDPWRVLIICILLNVTTGKQVRNVLSDLFNLCPNAKAATEVSTEEIEKVIKTLGFQKRRSKLIKRFSDEYLGSEWTHVTELYGVGKYAADAYAIFCAGKPDEVIPRDHKLVDYWNFIRSTALVVPAA